MSSCLALALYTVLWPPKLICTYFSACSCALLPLLAHSGQLVVSSGPPSSLRRSPPTLSRAGAFHAPPASIPRRVRPTLSFSHLLTLAARRTAPARCHIRPSACRLLLLCHASFWPPLAYDIPARDARAIEPRDVACRRLWPLIQTFWTGPALLHPSHSPSSAALSYLPSRPAVPQRQPMLRLIGVAVYDPLRPLMPVLDFEPPPPTSPDLYL